MKKRGFLVVFVVASVLFSGSLIAQEKKSYNDGFLKQVAVGVKAGTYGYGGDVSVSLVPHLKLRGGYSVLPYTYKNELDFTADAPNGGEVDGKFTQAKINFPNFNLMLDFYPWRQGVFCITAGAFFGQNKISLQGNAAEEFIFEDIVIKPQADGYFDGDLLLGGDVKPYAGIGIGRSIPKRRVGCKLELGVVAQGEYKVESSFTDNNVSLNKVGQDLDLPFSKSLLKLWPMLSFSISCRIY